MITLFHGKVNKTSEIICFFVLFFFFAAAGDRKPAAALVQPREEAVCIIRNKS